MVILHEITFLGALDKTLYGVQDIKIFSVVLFAHQLMSEKTLLRKLSLDEAQASVCLRYKKKIKSLSHYFEVI